MMLLLTTTIVVFVCVSNLDSVLIKKANEEFMACCLKEKVEKNCAAKICNYNATGDDIKSSLTDGVFSTTCSVANLKPLQLCAANFKDNSKCCQSKGILKNNEVCLQFCNPSGKADWPSNLFGAIKFKSCNDIHNDIIKCHLANSGRM